MQVLLTFDVENKYGSKTDLITADNIQYKPGTRWIMDKLEEHGHKGVFFVNIYEHMAYDRSYLSDLVQEIESRGHEAALHMHHEPYFSDPFLREYDNLTRLNKSELIGFGVQFFQDAIGKRPTSYRAGAFIIDDETFDVLDEAGLKVDSSLCFGYNLPGNSWISNKNRISEYQHIQLPYRIRPHLWEFPVTTIARGNTYRNLSIDHFHEKSIESAIEQMQQNNMPFTVLLGHSFSFLSFGETKREVLGPNLHAMQAFQNLLQFLKNKIGVSGTTFLEVLKDGDKIQTGSQSFVPQVEKNWIGKKIWTNLKLNSRLLKKSNLNPNAGKTVWLHIGTWKTGTTSIQKFLRLNEKWLKKNDYLLPTDPVLLNDPQAKWLCNHRPIILKNSDILKSLKKSILDSAEKNIILTSENIVYADLENIRHLRVALAGCTVKVVIYLRRQDQYSQSLYGQHIRGGVKTSLTFEQHFRQHKDKYQYDKILNDFSNIFGMDNIVVRPYEKAQWHNSDLIEDFCATIGLPPLDETMREKVTSTNFSFSLSTLRYIRESNKFDIKNRPLLIKYLGMFNNEKENISVFHHHNWISGQRQQQICDEFSAGNSLVANKFLGRDDGCLFYEPSPDVDELAGPDCLTVEEIMEISLYLWEASQADK